MEIHQLPRVQSYWQGREQVWNAYNQAFEDLPVFLPLREAREARHAHHLYTLLLDSAKMNISRDEFLCEMTKRNIGVGLHYIALNLHPFYRER